MNELSAQEISKILKDPFSFWPNYEAMRLSPISNDLISAISDYDKMVVNEWHTGRRDPNYNFRAHTTLINTLLFYRDKYDIKAMLEAE